MNDTFHKLPFNKNKLKHIVIITGHYGAGKTNIAAQLARLLASSGSKVAVVDLDIVNPYFRISECEDLLSDEHISLARPHYSSQTSSLDAPSLPASINHYMSPHNEFDYVIVDVGGDDEGARALGRYKQQLVAEQCTTLFVINAFRFMTQSAQEIEANMKEIASVLPYPIDYIINNSHIMDDTSLEEIQQGINIARQLCQKVDIPLLCSTYNPEIITKDVEMCEHESMLPLTPIITTPWKKEI